MICVSIINYRTGDMTIAAAQSVLDVLDGHEAKVVIVDNDSGDGSADQIADWVAKVADPRLELVRSTLNSGFSGGHNQGIAAAPEADYYLVLNSDALLRPGFFDAIMAVAEANPDAGLIAARLEDEDGTPQESHFRLPGPTSEFIRGAGSGPVTKLLKHRVLALGIHPAPEQVEWASFACILLNGRMVREIGDMDEGYFLYFEDTEYAMRARRAGWTLKLALEARAVHFRGGSGPVKEKFKARKRLPAYYWRSRTRYMRQAHGALGPLLANLAWMAGRALTQLRRLTGHGVAAPIEREWSDIWIGFSNPLLPWKDQ